MFNQYVWELYLKSGGSQVVEMFKKNLTEEITKEYATEIKKLQKAYCPCNDEIFDILRELRNDMTKQECMFALDDGEYTIDSALKFIYDDVDCGENLKPQEIFNFCMCCYIEYLSTVLTIQLPQVFIPYYFKDCFIVLENIANEFGIDLPKIPVKKDYLGRFFYYGDLCEVLTNFREEHNMSPYEFCAFLYDFAPKYVGGTSYIMQELPEPKSAYFIGAPKEADDLVAEKNIVTIWQCNPDTRAGDMIVRYLRTPISAVDSVWRSVCIGFNDPFFYYYRCTYIANPTAIKRITQKQLKEDAVFKDIPIVRKNMQGINGVELLPSQYNHLMNMANADVPRLEYTVIDNDLTFTREKDVENLLIIPLIKKLGYSDEEWEPQMYIEIGNHNKAIIPDFVILPNKTKGKQSAFAIIEAKLTIPNQKFLEEVQIQARSYARQLGTRYSVIASKEKIRIYTAKDLYSEEIFSASWEKLNDADTFSELYKLVGNR